ncbi:unnamed protein product [Symbiodinium sp. CCMP2456]|nr:unnamed protein product [Symbiodinium sp. CCMP2456]
MYVRSCMYCFVRMLAYVFVYMISKVAKMHCHIAQYTSRYVGTDLAMSLHGLQAPQCPVLSETGRGQLPDTLLEVKGSASGTLDSPRWHNAAECHMFFSKKGFWNIGR